MNCKMNQQRLSRIAEGGRGKEKELARVFTQCTNKGTKKASVGIYPFHVPCALGNMALPGGVTQTFIPEGFEWVVALWFSEVAPVLC